MNESKKETGGADPTEPQSEETETVSVKKNHIKRLLAGYFALCGLDAVLRSSAREEYLMIGFITKLITEMMGNADIQDIEDCVRVVLP